MSSDIDKINVTKMIVFEDGSCQTNSCNPDSNFLESFDCEQPKWVVKDGSELAGKILLNRYWEPVEDENGNLIDIVPIEPPEGTRSAEEQTEELKNRLDEIDRQAIRPLRAIAAGTATDEDRSVLAELEAQAEKIREEIAELSAGKAASNNG